MDISLLHILESFGFDGTRATRLVRHQSKSYPVKELRRHDWFELYQAYQRRPVFHDAEQIVSFYGLSGSRAGFYGVYKVGHHRPNSEGPAPAGCEWARRWKRPPGFFYELKRDQRFDGLRDRLIIHWPGARQWVQKSWDNNYVAEILECGRRLPPFSNYLVFRFIKTFTFL